MHPQPLSRRFLLAPRRTPGRRRPGAHRGFHHREDRLARSALACLERHPVDHRGVEVGERIHVGVARDVAFLYTLLDALAQPRLRHRALVGHHPVQARARGARGDHRHDREAPGRVAAVGEERGELGEDKHRYDEAVTSALRLGHAVFVKAPERSAEVVIAGQANLLDDVQPEQIRDLLRTLEDKETLIRLLDRTRTADGLQVFLGTETAMQALSGSSIVAASYGPEEQPIGALAVIGPMRMNYGKVMSVVDFTADTVSQLLADLSAKP